MIRRIVVCSMLLFIAAIRNIPKSYLEAAEIDGASAWKRIWHHSCDSQHAPTLSDPLRRGVLA